MKDVTIIIKTFERHYCLEALLESYQQVSKSMGWSCPILIADDSKEPYEAKIKSKFGDLVTHYASLPFNVGVSVGRNKLLERVETPYFLLCDDDFIFDKRADLAFMRNILKTTDIELIGGIVYNLPSLDLSNPKWWTLLRELRYGKFKAFWSRLFNKETLFRFQGNYEVKEDILYAKPFSYRSPYTKCDLVINFFMAETATFRKRDIKWNESMKTHEHEAFFYEAKQKGLQVATTDEVGIIHKQMHSTKYKHFRFPRNQYFKSFLKQQNLKAYINTIHGNEVIV